MQGIYKITNTINGKFYIGQTLDFKQRWRKHKQCKDNYPLYNAFRKYGIKNFTFEILEIVEDNKKLTEREEYYYNKMRPEYNLKSPKQTENNRLSKKVIQISIKDLSILNTFKSLSEASRNTGIATGSISKVCKRKARRAGDFYWCYEKDYTINWKPLESTAKEAQKIAMIDKNTNEIIKIFKSMTKASKETGIPSGNISMACNQKLETTGGYKWKKI